MGMYERAALIGAHLQVQSNPGEGTTVTVRVPFVSEVGMAQDTHNAPFDV
jgi:nitrate/nitrite-specific signal transduction histidine kinase